MNALANSWRTLWHGVRTVSGDDAYERYLAHWRACHGDEKPPSRAEFYRAELERKWSGLRRCC